MKYTDLARIYTAAGREIRTILLSIDLATFDGAQAEEVKRKARKVVAYLRAYSGRWARVVSMDAYAKSEKRTRDQLWRIGKRIARNPKPAHSGPRVVEDKVEVTLARATSSILQTVERYCAVSLEAARASRRAPLAAIQEFSFADAADEIGDMAIDAMKKESSRGVLMRQIRDFLADLVRDEQYIQIGSRMYNLGKYAKMVARTTLREAATQATLDLCHEYDNDLVEVSSHGTVCEICLPYEGQIYSISGNDPKYPHLDEQTPFHPNCAHSILPISIEEIRIREKGI